MYVHMSEGKWTMFTTIALAKIVNTECPERESSLRDNSGGSITVGEIIDCHILCSRFLCNGSDRHMRYCHQTVFENHCFHCSTG